MNMHYKPCAFKFYIILNFKKSFLFQELVAGQFSAYGKYYVTSEGTLFVYDVNSNDQGTYTCKNGISAVDKSSVRSAKITVESKFQKQT